MPYMRLQIALLLLQPINRMIRLRQVMREIPRHSL